jgi:signal transduction histidine kinase
MDMRWLKLCSLRSLRAQLLAAYVGGLLLTTVLIGVPTFILFTWQADAMNQHRLRDAAHTLARLQRFDASGRPAAMHFPAEWQWIYDALPGEVDLRVVDRAGRPVRTEPGDGRPHLLPESLILDPALAVVQVRIGDRNVHVATAPAPQSTSGYSIQAAFSERFSNLLRLASRLPLQPVMILIVVLALPVIGLLMRLTLRKLLRPLRAASEAAARIDLHNLSARIAADSVPTELAPLIDAFNLALERLEKGYRVQQEFLAAAAHELKTPLALVRGELELNGTADRALLLKDIDGMARQVHQLLHLAEASEAHNYAIGPTDVSAVAIDVVGFLKRLAEDSGVRLALELPAAPVEWQADQGALFSLLKNLVENAIQHSPKGGVVTVALEPGSISVRDRGAGIREEHLPHIFKRFWRGPGRDQHSGGGAGLGLSISQEIAAAHGWRLQASAALPGAVFRLGPSVLSCRFVE